MSKQFTVIITEKPSQARMKIKSGHEKIKEKSKTYFITEKDQRILLKPPKKGALKGYDADVVVNETLKTRLTQIPAGKNAVKVQKA